ncbi:dTDP-4-dehydrorhamnose 3,5-epimerase [Flavobacteriaceae bacterium]|nr:dTDP-4-dehydrorhamnose 3,5-epimerase [Flavobacteriaceae bacterium]
MKFFNVKIEGLVICEPTKYYDERGFFSETFRKDLFQDFIGHNIDFCQENFSESKFGVLRGLHFQKEPFSQSKLISVVKGKILDVAVDLRKNSKNYGENFCIELDDVKNQQLFIPKGFAHGFLVLSESAKVCYKVDNFYNPDAECGLNYNDPSLNIDWKINSDLIIVNKKDTNYPLFNSKNHFGG